MCLAIPGKVVETYQEHDVRMGKVDFGGIFKRVCLEHVPDAAIDDYVLVHVGFALSRIDEAEAMRVFEFLGSMDQLDELGGPSHIEPGVGLSDSQVDPPGPEPRAAAAARHDRGGSLP